jgi:acetyl esterase
VLQQLKGAAIRAAISRDWIVRWATRARAKDIAAGLDPQIAAALEYQRRARLPGLHTMDPVRARAFSEANLEAAELPAEPMAHVIDTTVAEQRLPVRIYEPHGAGKNWLVWLHGGGGVIGSINSSERICRYIASRTKYTVASVGYRLGPEDKHPASIDDACAAWEALLDRTDARIAVGGDSWGGYLAAHVDRWARRAGVRQPDFQVLVYPLIDLRHTYPSFERLADGYLLTRALTDYFEGHAFADTDDRYAASPISWADELAGSAPALVVTAAFDPLVDEGDAWAERLRAANVPVRHLRFNSLIHGFISLAGISRAAHAAVDELCQAIVDAPAW